MKDAQEVTLESEYEKIAQVRHTGDSTISCKQDARVQCVKGAMDYMI